MQVWAKAAGAGGGLSGSGGLDDDCTT